MAISKIKLGNGDPQAIYDAAALHYIGHATTGLSGEGNVWYSTSSITVDGISKTIKIYDYITYGDDNINYVCTAVDGEEGQECTWYKLTEKAAVIPVEDVKIGNTSIVTNKIATIPAATDAALGLVQAGTNIGISSGVISVADGSTSAKGVVKLANTVDGTSQTASTDVPTVAAVATAIADLPQAMIFKGTLGTVQDGGTIQTLPAAAVETAGDTYKVVTASEYSTGTSTTEDAEIGDLFICAKTGTDTYEWVLIPSGDVPAGTVTSVGVTPATGSNLTVSGSPITSSGTITVGVAADHTIPTDTKISNWDAAYAKVNPYTENTNIVTGLDTATAQSSGDGSVLIARVGGTDNDTLFIDYIKPTIDANNKAVVKPNA